MFSVAQQSLYRPLVKRAWLADSLRSGGNERDIVAYRAWYQRNLVEAIAMESTKKANKGEDFDLCMLQFAEIACDEYWIDRASRGAERRMWFVIDEKLKAMGELEGRVLDWSYVRAIYKQMNLPEDRKDCPAKLLWKIVQALDTHRRRILAYHGDLVPKSCHPGLGHGHRRHAA